MEFQTNLKKLRTEEGLTQDQLALLVETSTDTIGRIERKQKIASYEVLFRIARYFDKPVEDVFWYEWENKKRRLMLSWMWFPLMASALILFYDLSEGSKLHFRFDLDRSIFFVERYQLNMIFVLLIFFNISVTVQIEYSDIAIFQLVLLMNPYDENYLH